MLREWPKTALSSLQTVPQLRAEEETFIEALGDPPMVESEQASLEWLAAQELATVQNLAAVIWRSRGGAAAQP